MGCGESKHAVATENATVPKNKRSLSSKYDSTKDGKNIVKTENGVAEKVEKELIASKVVAVEKENVSEKKEMVELEKATKDEVVEKKEEKVVEPKNANDETAPVAVAEKKNTNDETTALVVEEKKESIPEMKPQDKNEEIIKPIEEEKEEEKEKEEVSSASNATDGAKPETAKDADKPETEEKPKEENATATTDSKTD